jgi:hypothetical protein
LRGRIPDAHAYGATTFQYEPSLVAVTGSHGASRGVERSAAGTKVSRAETVVADRAIAERREVANDLASRRYVVASSVRPRRPQT